MLNHNCNYATHVYISYISEHILHSLPSYLYNNKLFVIFCNRYIMKLTNTLSCLTSLIYFASLNFIYTLAYRHTHTMTTLTGIHTHIHYLPYARTHKYTQICYCCIYSYYYYYYYYDHRHHYYDYYLYCCYTQTVTSVNYYIHTIKTK